MNNQKDIKKTDINYSPMGGVSDVKALAKQSIYEFANKKTEKLVTALYLVSDCMDTDDALKGKIRLLGVELLSDIYKLSTLSPIEKHDYLAVSLSHIYELLSFIEIACTIGFISEMNTMILKNEFSFLIADLKAKQSKDKHFTFTLDQKMFELSDAQNSLEKGAGVYYKGQESIKDMSRNNADKRTLFNTMSFTNNGSPLSNFQIKKTSSPALNLADREDRTNKIISIIKDMSAHAGKKDSPVSDKGVSIKDISLAFTDCSEKTIQRELNSLVSNGKLKKTGAKRWSRYLINTN